MTATASDAVRVLIADDQPLVRGGFRMLVASQPDLAVVGEADDGAAAVDFVRTHAGSALAPDVVLMDVRMPGTNGIDATRSVLHLDPRVRVIVLTTFDLDEYALEGIHAGASGFLLKDARPEELLEAIRTVARGDAVIAPSTTRRLLSHLVAGAAGADAVRDDPAVTGVARAGIGQTGVPQADASRADAPRTDPARNGAAGAGGPVPEVLHTCPRDPWRDPRLRTLTAREREVFELIGNGLSNGEIMAELFLSEPTVKTHVSHILAKLGARDRVQAVVIAYETGVVLPG
ncbi:response regulator transcription factor [Kocuria sp. KD4]|uniref:response regulator transcription factor n=1 Tax=Kocuria sp. KD4 TaxID=2719588 RepID=UPI00142795B2|nr:response regulator transcription factor [Kocuria sp. KD4]QIR70608.1 response regulator transcription factor [Kocuria sp. KD4]